MERLKKLLAELAAIDGKLDALLAHDELSDDQRKEHAELTAARAKKLSAIDMAKAALARDEERARLGDEVVAGERAAASRPRVSNRQTTPDDPGHSRGVPVVNPSTIAVAPIDPRTRGFRNPREYLMCVMQAGQGRGVDLRLEGLYQPGREMAVGSDEGRGISDPAGGFLIPEAFSPDLLRIEPEADPMGGLTTKIPMSNPIVRMPCRVDKNHSTSVSGGLTVTRRPETVAGTASQHTFERCTLEAHGLFGLSYATEEILTDSPISFVALLETGFSDQFTYHLINERLNGTGVGEFLGVLQSPCLVTITKETGQAATTLVYENILKMRARCWGYGKAVWLANHDTMPQLMLLNQSVGTGGMPVWQPSAREDAPDLLLGRPLIFTEYTATLGTVGDVVLGNWSEYLEGTYQPMLQAESIHVRFINHERAFKFWLRNAGLPWWKSALTPKNGSNTLSPFVVVGTRS